jgi:molecular chaperone GrpE (heat shock protein)
MEESVVDNDAESHALRDVRAGLLNVLSIAGVESFDVGPDEPFDASRHQGVGRTDTDDVALDGTVARMRRCGFVSDDGRIVRAAEVEVYRAR